MDRDIVKGLFDIKNPQCLADMGGIYPENINDHIVEAHESSSVFRRYDVSSDSQAFIPADRLGAIKDEDPPAADAAKGNSFFIRHYEWAIRFPDSENIGTIARGSILKRNRYLDLERYGKMHGYMQVNRYTLLKTHGRTDQSIGAVMFGEEDEDDVEIEEDDKEAEEEEEIQTLILPGVPPTVLSLQAIQGGAEREFAAFRDESFSDRTVEHWQQAHRRPIYVLRPMDVRKDLLARDRLWKELLPPPLPASALEPAPALQVEEKEYDGDIIMQPPPIPPPSLPSV